MYEQGFADLKALPDNLLATSFFGYKIFVWLGAEIPLYASIGDFSGSRSSPHPLQVSIGTRERTDPLTSFMYHFRRSAYSTFKVIDSLHAHCDCVNTHRAHNGGLLRQFDRILGPRELVASHVIAQDYSDSDHYALAIRTTAPQQLQIPFRRIFSSFKGWKPAY